MSFSVLFVFEKHLEETGRINKITFYSSPYHIYYMYITILRYIYSLHVCFINVLSGITYFKWIYAAVVRVIR